MNETEIICNFTISHSILVFRYSYESGAEFLDFREESLRSEICGYYLILIGYLLDMIPLLMG